MPSRVVDDEQVLTERGPTDGIGAFHIPDGGLLARLGLPEKTGYRLLRIGHDRKNGWFLLVVGPDLPKPPSEGFDVPWVRVSRVDEYGRPHFVIEDETSLPGQT